MEFEPKSGPSSPPIQNSLLRAWFRQYIYGRNKNNKNVCLQDIFIPTSLFNLYFAIFLKENFETAIGCDKN